VRRQAAAKETGYGFQLTDPLPDSLRRQRPGVRRRRGHGTRAHARSKCATSGVGPGNGDWMNSSRPKDRTGLIRRDTSSKAVSGECARTVAPGVIKLRAGSLALASRPSRRAQASSLTESFSLNTH
jgi:hypothetical protein